MKVTNLLKKLYASKKNRFTALLVVTAISFTGLAATGWANALYILTGTDSTAIILDDASPAPDLSSQIFYLASSARGYDIVLTDGLSVSVRRNGSVQHTEAQQETISELLVRLGIAPSPFEMVAIDLSESRAEITVSEDITYYDEIVEEIPYTTRRVANPDMPHGAERVIQTGADGLRTAVYEVVWANGKQVSKQFVEELSNTSVEEVIEYGTKVSSVSRDDELVDVLKNADGSGTLVFASGVTLDFSEAKSMTATAYTGGHAGVGYITASGTHVQVGTVAVDKNVIPLGTRMFIVTEDGIVYGMGLAEDTGVRGNKVDLYHNTYFECINFGRRACTVYILE